MASVLQAFVDPDVTVDGKRRASVPLVQLQTLWFNTGTLCNLTCQHCYIESSPRNDRLAYLTPVELERYLDELVALGQRTEEIGFTGGEPFLNPDIIDLLGRSLVRGFRVLVLTNAMRPMMKHAERLEALRDRFGAALCVRVSLDHFRPELHEAERGPRTWKPTLAGLKWLSDRGFAVHVAGRSLWGGTDDELRAGYAALFAAEGIDVDTHDPRTLVLFPEMDSTAAVPEITTECWDILHKSPSDVMCATSRMVIKRKGEAPSVVSCTLLPYDERFDFGPRLADALGAEKLNHPHCAKFCVLGGGRCSG